MKISRRFVLVLAGIAAFAGLAYAAAVYVAHPIMGWGVAADPISKWYPASTSFGGVIAGTTADRTIRLKNVGRDGLTGSIRVDPACNTAGVYSVMSGGGTYTLNNGQSREVVIRFAPADTIRYPDCRVICTP